MTTLPPSPFLNSAALLPAADTSAAATIPGDAAAAFIRDSAPVAIQAAEPAVPSCLHGTKHANAGEAAGPIRKSPTATRRITGAPPATDNRNLLAGGLSVDPLPLFLRAPRPEFLDPVDRRDLKAMLRVIFGVTA
jgi:hypothetical protein